MKSQCICTCTLLVIVLFLVSSFSHTASRQEEEPDYKKLEYGGVIGREDNTASASSEDIRAVTKFALSFIGKRLEDKAVSHFDFDVTAVRKVSLLYTYDDKSPAVLESEAENGDVRTEQLHISFGHLYSFSLTGILGQVLHTHGVTVSEYPVNVFNIYTHTYHMTPVNNTCFLSSSTKTTEEFKTCQSISLSSPIKADVTSHIDQSYYPYQKYMRPSTDTGGDQAEENNFNKEYVKSTNGREDSLKVLTYNTWNMNTFSGNDGDYVKRIQQFGKISLEMDADIICFQEVRYQYNKGGNLGPNQIHHLADMLKDYQFVFMPGQLQSNSLYEGRTEEGVAIFSKYPVIYHTHIKLFRNKSNSADTHQRVCLHAQVLHPLLGIVNILTTHLSLSHEAREKSVVQIWKYVQTLEGPVIFCGDLNAEPQEEAIRFLQGDSILDGEKTNGFYDVWAQNYPDIPGLTYNSLYELQKRIDYIFIRKFNGLEVDAVSVTDDGSRGYEAASDHLPLTVKFKVH